MLFSLLGSSLLNAGLGGGNFKDAFKNIGLGFAGNLGTAIPALFGSIGQSGKRMPSYGDTGFGRSLLDTNKRVAQIGLAKKQKDIIKKARSAQGTISAYLAGRGFAKGGSTEMILANQNLNNAMEDIEMAGLDSAQRVLTAETKQLQEDYSMMNNFEASYFAYEDPVTKFIKESFVQPMVKQNLSEIGGMVTTSIEKHLSSPKKEVVQEQTESLRLNPNFFQPLISNKWIMPKL